MEETGVGEAVGKRAQNCKAKMGDLVTGEGKINNHVGNIEDKCNNCMEKGEINEGCCAGTTVRSIDSKINDAKMMSKKRVKTIRVKGRRACSEKVEAVRERTTHLLYIIHSALHC